MRLRTDIDIKPITPCPIKDAVVEIRFDGSLDKVDELFFHIYNSVKELFKNSQYIRLPVVDIPLNVRKTNKNFEYTPHYQLNGTNYVIRVAPCAISIGLLGEYSNWDNFSQFIGSVIDKYTPGNIQRIGLRYISFFDINIFEKTNIKLTIGDNSVSTGKNLIRHEFETDVFKCVLQISNIAAFTVGVSQIQGSNIDIDVIYDVINENINVKEIIASAHTTMKNLLSTILTDEFIKELQNG